MRRHPAQARSEFRGFSLVELMIMLVVLTLGILAVARLIPTSTRESIKDRERTSGNYYAQDRMEQLRALGASSPDLAQGRHPGATNNESCGPRGAWSRYWTVTPLDPPLDNMNRLDVVVRWTVSGRTDSVIASTYQGR